MRKYLSVSSVKISYSLLKSLIKPVFCCRGIFSVLLASVFIFALIFAGMPFAARAEEGLGINNWWQSLRTERQNQVFNLEYEELVLPGEEFKTFSEKGQEKLYDLARRFGDEGVNEEEMSGLFLEDRYETLQDNNEGEFTLSSRFNLTVTDDIEEEREDPEGALSDLNLEFILGERTTLTAGMENDFASDLDAYDFSDDEEITDGENAADMEEMEALLDEERLEETDEEAAEGVEEGVSPAFASSDPVESNTENEFFTEGGSVGLIYEPMDFLSLSADLKKSDILSSEWPDSASLGLELSDALGNLRASYRIDESQSLQQTTTGVEVELMDFARVSASYSLLDMDELEDKLEQQTGVDLGLDFQFTNFSFLSLGYQWQENLLDDEELDEDYESNIRASFTIDF